MPARELFCETRSRQHALVAVDERAAIGLQMHDALETAIAKQLHLQQGIEGVRLGERHVAARTQQPHHLVDYRRAWLQMVKSLLHPDDVEAVRVLEVEQGDGLDTAVKLAIEQRAQEIQTLAGSIRTVRESVDAGHVRTQHGEPQRLGTGAHTDLEHARSVEGANQGFHLAHLVLVPVAHARGAKLAEVRVVLVDQLLALRPEGALFEPEGEELGDGPCVGRRSLHGARYACAGCMLPPFPPIASRAKRRPEAAASGLNRRERAEHPGHGVKVSIPILVPIACRRLAARSRRNLTATAQIVNAHAPAACPPISTGPCPGGSARILPGVFSAVTMLGTIPNSRHSMRLSIAIEELSGACRRQGATSDSRGKWLR